MTRLRAIAFAATLFASTPALADDPASAEPACEELYSTCDVRCDAEPEDAFAACHEACVQEVEPACVEEDLCGVIERECDLECSGEGHPPGCWESCVTEALPECLGEDDVSPEEEPPLYGSQHCVDVSSACRGDCEDAPEALACWETCVVDRAPECAGAAPPQELEEAEHCRTITEECLEGLCAEEGAPEGCLERCLDDLAPDCR